MRCSVTMVIITSLSCFSCSGNWSKAVTFSSSNVTSFIVCTDMTGQKKRKETKCRWSQGHSPDCEIIVVFLGGGATIVSKSTTFQTISLNTKSDVDVMAEINLKNKKNYNK